MQLNLKPRSASVSFAGKSYDHYFSGPHINHPKPRASSLGKSASLKSIALPKVKGAQPKMKTEEKSEENLPSQKRRNKEIENKIKKEIAALRSGSSKKLKLVPKEEKRPSISAQNSEEKAVRVQSWKDLKKVAPSNGYLYIDCANEPKKEKE